MVRRHLAVIVFLAGFAAVGMTLVPDYGVAWDDVNNRRIGRFALQAVTDLVARGTVTTAIPPAREHGTVLEVLLLAVEKGIEAVNGDLSSRQRYMIRHGAIFLVFVLGLAGFYRLNLEIFRVRFLALAGVLLLALHPRIFAHAFFNSYDIGFLTAAVWCVWTLLFLLRRPSLARAALHAATTALAIDIRIVGLLFVGITGCLWLLRAVRPPGGVGSGWPATAVRIGGYLVLTAVLVVVLWPYLWSAPLERFADAFESMRRIVWSGDTIYRGQAFPQGIVPWHYSFVWIGITTPLPLLALILIGAIATPFARARRFRESPGEAAGFLAAWLWAGIPLLLPVLLRPALMDGWRHHYFVYPALVVLALFAVVTLREQAARISPLAAKAAVGAAVALPGLNSVYATVAMHPYQNVYFNALVGERARLAERYDLDYWGLSYRRALEYILAHDTRPTIRVVGLNRPVRFNTYILTEAERRRIRVVRNIRRADYFVSNFRDGRSGYRIGTEVFAITVAGIKIMTVRRL